MKWFASFIGFEGRIGRKTFWLASITVLAAAVVLTFIVAFLAVLLSATPKSIDTGLDFISYVFLYPQFLLAVKRGHDRNIATPVISICYALIVSREVLVSLGWLVDFADEHVATTRGVVSWLAIMLVGVVALALLVELGFRRGTRGPNRFGPDPLAKAELGELNPAT